MKVDPLDLTGLGGPLGLPGLVGLVDLPVLC